MNGQGGGGGGGEDGKTKHDHFTYSDSEPQSLKASFALLVVCSM